ncbi:hypothetical protein G3O08_13960 [Cryomorpha ignava]|uniref:DUF4465 domain-containing protein n=1 Tax=Cryomorpha ignava TaxID=101383 RepID=A0A7K3WSD5_9FLAO|nr:hypothetical protein [Cryomorpha ignava]NEN24609.1 hypothetical protein [Cryomorpha ignava]
MKIFKKQINVAATLFVAAALIFTTSCTKDNENSASASQKYEGKAVKDKALQEDIQSAADRMPPIAWYNRTMDKVIVFDPKNDSKSFDFSDPNDGWNFSEDDGVEFVENPNGGGVLFVSPGAFGSNAGGSGTVVAGNTALNVNYTFCFSVDEDALGLDLGFGDVDFDGLSGVLGIAGDFDALMNEDFDEEGADIFDYFQGLAYYLVYDNEAQGNYDILNFIEDLEGAEDENGKGFSVVYGFTSTSFAFYFSKDGTLNVSGGSMNFSGNYYGIVFDNLLDTDGDGDLLNLDFVDVPGFGQMGCN